MAKHKLFVYGTLRGDAPATHVLPGYRMFLVKGKRNDFPFVQETDGYACDDTLRYNVVGNIIEVDDEVLEKLDLYEGVASGLYVRERIMIQILGENNYVEAWVYVGGPQLAYQPIDSGDWLRQ